MLIKHREVPTSSSIWNIWLLQVAPINIPNCHRKERERELLQDQAKAVPFDVLVGQLPGDSLHWLRDETAPGLEVLTV